MYSKKRNLREWSMGKPLSWALVMLYTMHAPSVFAAKDQKSYAANALEGWVIEMGGKTPMEGVIAVVNWELVDSTNLPIGQRMVIETVTDQNGHFVFPAKKLKPLPSKSMLDQKTPQLLLFKEGFQYRRLSNQVATGTSMSAAFDTDWNGKTIEMRRLPKDAIVRLGPGRVVSKRSLSFNGLSFSLDWVYRGRDCEWKQAPRMLAAIHQTRLEFERQGLRTDLKSIDDLPHSDKCGSPRDYLRKYLP